MLVDIRHAPSENDRVMYRWILEQGWQPVILATKLDKLKRSQVQKQLREIREGLQMEKGGVIIPFSAETKDGREKIWEMITQVL